MTPSVAAAAIEDFRQTFAAVRRTMAIGALESAGIDDLGSGDPQQFVGSLGADAATLRRHR